MFESRDLVRKKGEDRIYPVLGRNIKGQIQISRVPVEFVDEDELELVARASGNGASGPRAIPERWIVCE